MTDEDLLSDENLAEYAHYALGNAVEDVVALYRDRPDLLELDKIAAYVINLGLVLAAQTRREVV